MPFLLLLLLLAFAASTAGSTSLPQTITYLITVRSFMASICRPDAQSVSAFDLYCPDDDDIKQRVRDGVLMGHPDFERYVQPVTYKAMSGPPNAYNTSYGGNRLPLVYNNSKNRHLPHTFVTSLLREESTGIYKMQYCDETTQEGYPCDYQFDPRAVKDRDSFSTWYADNKRFNIRSGYEQDLRLKNSTLQLYEFDAAEEDSKIYDPITQHHLEANAFPMSTRESNGFNLSSSEDCPYYDEDECFRGKFSFTTEIHTFFQYRGNESFLFKGDDDVHIFINKRLAINLGGEHNSLDLTIALDSYTKELGLELGKYYAFDMFHAERQTRGSNYAISTTLGQDCNVVNVDLAKVSTLIDWKNRNFVRSDWFILAGPGYGQVINNVAYLMRPNVPDVASFLFYRGAQNVGSGFTLEFSFRMSGGKGHGFALLIQNRGLEDFNAGATGPNLGVKNMNRSVAVVFDACANYPNCGMGFQLRLHYDNNGTTNNVSPQTRHVYDEDVMQDWSTDHTWHNVKVYYYASPDWLEVYVDNSLRLVERNFDLIRILGNRDAYIGFASSSSLRGSSLQVEISEVLVRTVSIDYTKTVRDLNTPIAPPGGFVADGRSEARVQILTQDFCGTPYTSGGLGNLTQGRLVSAASSAPRQGRRLQGTGTASSVPARVVDNFDGSYSLLFSTNIPGEYDIHVAFGDNCGAWNGTAFPQVRADGGSCWTEYLPRATSAAEFITLAPTRNPTSPGEGAFDWEAFKWTMIGLGILICCCCLWIIIYIRLYRERWRKDKKFVKPGEMALIERGMDYGNNPMAIQMTVLSGEVQKIRQEIEKLRARDPVQEDARTLEYKKEYTEMNERLKGEVVYLKRKQQAKADMEATAASNMTQSDASSRRISFKPQRVPINRPQPTSMVNYSSKFDDVDLEQEEMLGLPPSSPRSRRADPPPLYSSPGSATKQSPQPRQSAIFARNPATSNAEEATEGERTVWEEEERRTKLPPPPVPAPHVYSDSDESGEEESYLGIPPPASSAGRDHRHEPSPRRLSVSGADSAALVMREEEEEEEMPRRSEQPSRKREFRYE